MQLRDLPSVDRVMASDRVAALVETYSRDWVVEVVREQLDHARQRVRQGGTAPATGELAEDVCRQIADMNRISPRRVINATGVVIHTNLGRAPLSMDAIVAMTQASQGYSDLELDLGPRDAGGPGKRISSLCCAV